MGKCVVCRHAKIEAINAALGRRVKDGVVAAQYKKLTKADVQNHREQCLADRRPIYAIQTEAGTFAYAETQRLTDEVPPEGWLLKPREVEATGNVSIHIASEAIDAGREPGECCTCGWCVLTSYRRLLRAWREASRVDRERLAIEAQLPEPPC